MDVVRSEEVERVATVLSAFYAWSRETAAIAEKVQRDRGAGPALDALLQQTGDAALGELAAGLGAARTPGGNRPPVIRLALEFRPAPPHA